MRNVLVTGGSSGVGAALVAHFARQGDTVWFTYHVIPSAFRDWLVREGLHFDTALAASPSSLPALLPFARPGHVLHGTDWPFGGTLHLVCFADVKVKRLPVLHCSSETELREELSSPCWMVSARRR